jgi:hypothetical protein
LTLEIILLELITINKGIIMKLEHFKMLGVAAVLVAAGMQIHPASAAQYGTAVSSPEQKIEKTESLTIFNLVGKVLKKTEPTAESQAQATQDLNTKTNEVMNSKATGSFESAKYGTIYNVGDDRMSNEDILIASTKKPDTKKPKSQKKINKGDILLNPNENPKPPEMAANPSPEIKPGDILLKTWEKTKNVASNVAEKGKESFMAAKAKVDAENERKNSQPKIVQAEAPKFGEVTSQDVIKAKDKVVDGVSNFLSKLRSSPQQEDTNKIKPN